MNKKLGMMALTGALALVACSQGGGTGGGTTTNHKLTVNFSGVASAPITITNSAGTVVDSETVSSGFNKTLPAGTYTVSAGPVTGYNPVASQQANLNTADVALTFTFTATGTTNPRLPQVAKAVNLVSIKDVANIPLPFQQEVNDNKVATLFAAQTEESVCVIAKVVDANNAAVANSTVSIATTYTGTVDIQDGCLANVTSQTVKAQAGDVATVTTDANGFARFRVFATYSTGNTSGGFNADPAKFVISAKDSAGNQLTPLEIKGFFLNMSHLYVQEGTVGANNTTPGTVAFPLDPATGKPANSQGTADRVGDTVNFNNVYGLRSNPGNIAPFNVFAYQKQPVAGPLYLPTASVFNRGLSKAQVNSYVAPGYVQYDLTGPDASKFQFVPSGDGNDAYSGSANFGNSGPFQPLAPGSYAYSTAATSYRDYANNSGVQIQPKTGVTLPANGQFNVQLKATYVFEAQYGNNPDGSAIVYDFPLKDVTINKTFNQGLLTINKFVDHHVLTWAGAAVSPSITLPSNRTTGGADAYTTATYTIEVKNTGTQPVFNATVADQIPAELGVVTSTISNGGTYDAVKHAITWNYGSLTSLATVNPSDPVIKLTFQVYARQKPGFKWTGGNVANPIASATAANPAYTIQPLNPNPAAAGDAAAIAATGVPYSDPYAITDGNQFNDTTISYFPQQGSFSNQVTTDYNPVADESTVNVVRPLFRLTKTLQTERVPAQGAGSVFNVTLTQLDRTGLKGAAGPTELNPYSYATLLATYPGEFDGKSSNVTTAKDAAGNTVDTVTTAARQNPYGINVGTVDEFQQPFDFTNATPITITNPAGAPLTATVSPVVPAPGATVANQNIAWQTIPVLQGLDTGAAQITLTLDQNNTFTGQVYNCAYLTADNLNQPARFTALYTNSWYYLVASTGKHWVDGVQTAAGTPTPTFGSSVALPSNDDEVQPYGTATGATSTGGTSTGATSTAGTSAATPKADYPGAQPLFVDANNAVVYDALQRGIQACDYVRSVATVPNLAITTQGEYVTATPGTVEADKTDPVNGGVTYYYKESITNSGARSQATATATYTLANANAAFAAGAKLYYSSNGGQTFTDSGLTPTTSNANTVVFTNFVVPGATSAGLGLARIVLPTTAATPAANTTVTETLTGRLDYNGNVDPAFPKTVTENTTISGPIQ